MPFKDGTGPVGRGPMGGRGRGAGIGRGAGMGMGRGANMGVSGFCVCIGCGEKIPHQRGIRCAGISCPKCGKPMIRE